MAQIIVIGADASTHIKELAEKMGINITHQSKNTLKQPEKKYKKILPGSTVKVIDDPLEMQNMATVCLETGYITRFPKGYNEILTDSTFIVVSGSNSISCTVGTRQTLFDTIITDTETELVWFCNKKNLQNVEFEN